MKKVFLMLMVALPALLFAQKNPDNYTIKGKIGTLNAPARAYLIYDHGTKEVVDSVTIVNGEFKFHGYAAEPASAYLVIDPLGLSLNDLRGPKNKEVIDALDFYLDKANIVLSPVDTLSQAKISGSKVNDDNKRFKDLMAPYIQRANQIRYDFNSVSEAQQLNPNFRDAIAAKSKMLQTEQTDALKNFIATNPQSYVSLSIIQLLIRSGMPILSIEGLYTGLAPAIKQTELGLGFASAIKELKTTAVGAQAPEFTQNDAKGTPVSLSSFKGKYVLIDFWASWCKPYRETDAHIVAVYNQYKDKNFTILGVSLDKPEEKELWLKAIKDDGLVWTQVSDLKYWQNEAANMYKVSFLPQNFLIDPTGKIVAKNLKGKDLDAKLAEILK